MYRIVGKENLHAVEDVAQKALIAINEVQQIEDEVVKLNKNTLLALSTGYLFLYNIIVEEGLMPNHTSAKHKIFNLH